MAIQKAISLPNGIELSNAYHKVTMLIFWLREKRAVFELSIYKDADARKENKKSVMSFQCDIKGDDFDKFLSTMTLDNANTNPIKQVYTYIKLKRIRDIDYMTSIADV
jgi:hypothetical protein